MFGFETYGSAGTLSPVRRPTRWIWERAVEWWWLDVPVAVVVVVALAQAVRPGTGIDFLGRLSLEDRRAIYTDIMQLASLFGTLSGLGFTVYLTLGSDRIRMIKKMAGVRILRMWLVALSMPWLVALVMVVAKVVDRGGLSSRNSARVAVLVGVVVLVLQLARLVWVFYQLAVVDLHGDRPARRTTERPIEVIRRRA